MGHINMIYSCEFTLYGAPSHFVPSTTYRFWYQCIFHSIQKTEWTQGTQNCCCVWSVMNYGVENQDKREKVITLRVSESILVCNSPGNIVVSE